MSTLMTRIREEVHIIFVPTIPPVKEPSACYNVDSMGNCTVVDEYITGRIGHEVAGQRY